MRGLVGGRGLGSCENLVRTSAALVPDDCRDRLRPGCRIRERLGDGRIELEDSPEQRLRSGLDAGARNQHGRVLRHLDHGGDFPDCRRTARLTASCDFASARATTAANRRRCTAAIRSSSHGRRSPSSLYWCSSLITARTIYTVQAAARPPDALSVHVIAHQWWWEFRYPDLGVVTANELHVPLSDPKSPTPTFLDLESADVAHSFWVPRLAGKTDVIPNKKNSMWIDPHVAGTYLGQCAEYCGTEHALDAAARDRRAARRLRSMGRGAEAAARRRRVRRARAPGLRIHRMRQLPHDSRHRGATGVSVPTSLI